MAEYSFNDSILSLIGRTPLVRLSRVAPSPLPTILAKLEFLNPGGSVKDRIGVAMLEEAIKLNKISTGGTIVEPTSGNTGVGLAIAATILGFKLVVTMPDKMSREKKTLLEAYGAKVVICPTDVAPDDPRNYIQVAKRISIETQNAYMPDQYSNPVNPRTHYATTGKEIWEQTNGKITHFVAGVGTGGTISGVGKYLKEKKTNVKVIGIDPVGSIFYRVFHRSGANETWEGRPYKIEGIGEDFIPKTTDLGILDDIMSVSDKEAYSMSRRLAREEALLVGSSSGAAVAGAIRIANDLKKDDLMVVLLPDRGERYLSKIYNDDWMKAQGFLD